MESASNNLYKFIGSIILVGLVCGGGFWAYKKYGTPQNTVNVVKGEVIEKVTVSARAKSMADVSLGFEFDGKVLSVGVKEGQQVEKGSLLATLDTITQEKNVSKALANYNLEVQQLKELERGNRPEDIQVTNAEVAEAEQGIRQSSRILANAIKDAYLAADDAITNKTDQFFKDPREANPEIFFLFGDYNLKNNINETRLYLTLLLKDWKAIVDGVDSNNVLPKQYETTLTNLNTIRTYLNQVAKAASLFKASDDGLFVQAQIDKYRSDTGEARSEVAAAYSTLSNAIEQYNLAVSRLEVTQKQLILKKSGTSSELISAQQERVRQAEADLGLAKSALSKTGLLSPISGIVTAVDIEAGEVVRAGAPVVTIISDNTFEIEAEVPEIHVGKIDIGKDVDIVFDAFPNTVYKGSVVRIDASPTYIDGIVNYKTTIQFESENAKDKLRDGMTATATIIANHNGSAFVIPAYAVEKRQNGDFVRKLEDGVLKEIPINIGIKGDNGFVEVLNGLQEGDIVVVDKV